MTKEEALVKKDLVQGLCAMLIEYQRLTQELFADLQTLELQEQKYQNMEVEWEGLQQDFWKLQAELTNIRSENANMRAMLKEK